MKKKEYVAPYSKVYAVLLEKVVQTSPDSNTGAPSPQPESLSFGGDDSSPDFVGSAVSEARERSSFAPDSPWEQIW